MIGRSDDPEAAAAVLAPLSAEQARMWLLDRLDPGNVAAHIRLGMRVEGDLDPDRLRAALNAVIARHEILRTRFDQVDDRPVQRIEPRFESPLTLHDVSTHADANRRATHEATRVVQRPFDLAAAPPWRAAAIQIAADAQLLVLCMHHIVCDGDWSLGLLFDEWAAAYGRMERGEHPDDTPPAMQYRDVVRLQAERLASPAVKDQEVWWLERLAGYPGVLSLPTDRPRPPAMTYAGGVHRVQVSVEAADRITALGRAHGCDAFATWLAGLVAVLHRYTGQPDIAIGSPVHGRTAPEAKGAIGYFGNPLVLRSHVDGDAGFDSLLRTVGRTVGDAAARGDCPFQDLFPALHLERDPGISPLFQVLFVLRDDGDHPWAQRLPRTRIIDGRRWQPVDIDSGFVPYDLFVSIADRGGPVEWTFEYRTDLFDAATIEQMAAHCLRLLDAATRSPEMSLGDLPMMTAAERTRLLVDWNRTAGETPRPSVVESVAAQAERDPDAMAIEGPAGRSTYGDLWRESGRIAARLAAIGVERGDAVAVCLEREPGLIAAVLGIMRAGACCVPLDVAYPIERLRTMLDDAEVRATVSRRSTLEARTALSALLLDTALVDLDEGRREDDTTSATLGATIKPDDPAYLLFTSGSSGRPKGVVMPHRALSNLVAWHRRQRFAEPGARMLQLSPISFDIAFHEIFATLASGGVLVQLTEATRRNPIELARCLDAQRIEKLYLPFFALQQLAEASAVVGYPRHLVEVFTAGEQLQSTPPVRAFFAATGARLHNHYGGTEIQDVAAYTLPADPESWDALPPVGRPIDGLRLYVLDARQQPVPPGVIGELYVAGAGLARGYHRRPDLDAARFVTDLCGEARLYRTFDLARFRRNGDLDILGRADGMVKVRGHRVELGEVESALAELSGVGACVVDVRDWRGELHLVGYVVPTARDDAGLDGDALRAALARTLPAYMVPTTLIALPTLPRTPSGKIDRRALPEPSESDPDEAPAAVDPSQLEKRVAAVWRDVLGRDSVSHRANFFDLGGTSLSLMQAHAALTRQLAVELSPLAMFQYPTVEALAEHLRQLVAADGPEAEARPARRRSSRTGDIAVIGLAARVPGADDPRAFWRNLCDGVESIRFFDDAELEQVDPQLRDHPDYVKAGSVIEGIEDFDAAFFGFTPREAEIMDPQQRVFLECAWEALEDAGHTPGGFAGRVGVFGGSGFSTYLINNLVPHFGFSSAFPLIEADILQMQLKVSNDRSYLTTNVSYRLGLTGPSVNVQSACSTSLVAVHVACQSLWNGECEMALAGGACIVVPQKAGYLYQEGMVRPADAHCRAFDAAAQGTLLGNGAGVVALRPLEDALADGDAIVAVIKGSAVNNDGAEKIGFKAPSIVGQSHVIADAIADAGIDPHTIRYVETHGTATHLGDPVEMAGLTQGWRRALGADDGRRQWCAIGSVKSNIGHLDEAAGIAGFIKAALVTHHGQIPPSLNYTAPNPRIDFADSPFFVSDRLQPWPDDGPRRCGVSSIGLGGTNCHMILEQAPPVEPARIPEGIERAPRWHILTLGARCATSLRELAARYRDHLANHPDLDWADVCFTTQIGRTHFDHRLAVAADGVAPARDALAEWLDTGEAPPNVHVGVAGEAPPRIGFLYTGLGCVRVDMARALYASQPVFRAALDRQDALLVEAGWPSLLGMLYPVDDTGSRLRDVAYAQPALFAVQSSLAALWASWGIEPTAVMGHSAGEYAAAARAGVFDVADGLRLIAQRGRVMQATPNDGDMAAVMTSEAQALAACAEVSGVVTVGVINGPQSVVLAGERAAVAAACDRLAADGVKVKRLGLPGASHCALMAGTVEVFASHARAVDYRTPERTLISNVTGAPIRSIDAAYWGRHTLGAVRFGDGMRAMAETGIDTFVEIGARPTLLGLGRRCLPDHDGPWLPSLRPGADAEAVMASSLAALFVRGAQVDWAGVHRGFTRRRVSLPTYAWQRQRHWITPPKGRRPAARPGAHPLLGQTLDLAGVDGVRFEARVDAGSPAWLTDHRLFGTVVMPGVAWIEVALAAGRVVFDGAPFALRDLVIRDACVVPDEGETTLQTVLTPRDEGFDIEIFARVADGDWQRHATGRLTVEAAPIATQPALDTADPVDVQGIYGGDDPLFPLGPRFRVIDALDRAGDRWRGRLRARDTVVPEVDAYAVHPTLLDAALTPIALDAAATGDTYVPVAFDVVRYTPGPGAAAFDLHAESTFDPDAGLAHGRARLVDDQGRCRLDIEGVLFKRTDRKAMLGLTHAPWQRWLHRDVWRPRPAERAGPAAGERWLLVTAGRLDGLAEALRTENVECHVAHIGHAFERIATDRWTVDLEADSPFHPLIEALSELTGVVFDGELAPAGDDPARVETLVVGAAALVRALADRGGPSTRLFIVTRGAQPVRGRPVVDPAQTALWGFGRVAALEHPGLGCVRIDLDPQRPIDPDALRIELGQCGSSEDEVGHAAGQRLVPRLEPHPPLTYDAPLTLDPASSYLITGGLGNLGLLAAEWMVAHGARHLTLVGRRAPRPAAVPRLDALRGEGATVAVVTGDVSRADDVERVLATIARTGRRLAGIVHCAGGLDDGVIAQLTPARFRTVLAPKVSGAWLLHRTTADLDFFVSYASSSGLVGTAGQANYAAANAYLDGLAAQRTAQGLPGLAVDWGMWGTAAMGDGPALDERYTHGEGQITPEDGMQALAQLLVDPAAESTMGVLPIEWPTFVRRWPRVPARLAGLAGSGESTARPSASIRDTLAAAEPGRQRALLADFLIQRIGRVVGAAAVEDMTPDTALLGLGFDSLMVIELRNALQLQLGCRLPFTLLLDHPTFGSLLDRLADVLGVSDDRGGESGADTSPDDGWISTAVPIRSTGARPPLFCVSGVLGSVLEFEPLAHALGPDQPLYGLRALGLSEDVRPYDRIEDIARHHVRAIRAVQPAGPYRLIGHSFGGKVAFEMARQLVAAGETVPLLAVLDGNAAPMGADGQIASWSDADLFDSLVDIYQAGQPEPLQLPSADTASTALGDRLGDLATALERAGHGLEWADLERIWRVYSANMRCFVDYTPQKTSGVRPAFIRAAEAVDLAGLPSAAETAADPTWGWGPVCDGPLAVSVVPGNHFTMLAEPGARALADQIGALMESIGPAR